MKHWHQGATSIEYAVIAFFLSIVIAAVVAVIGDDVLAMFAEVAARFRR